LFPMTIDLEKTSPELNVLGGDQRYKSARIPHKISSEVHHHLTSPSTSSTIAPSPRTMTPDRLKKEWVVAVLPLWPPILNPFPRTLPLTYVQEW